MKKSKIPKIIIESLSSVAKEEKEMQIITDFIKFAYLDLGIKKAPEVHMTDDKNFTKEYTSYGSYTPSENKIIVYRGNRTLPDFLRTLGHEMVHHKQNEMNELTDTSGETGSEIENEANATAGVLLRNYGKKNPLIYEGVNKIKNKEILKEIVKRVL